VIQCGLLSDGSGKSKLYPRDLPFAFSETKVRVTTSNKSVAVAPWFSEQEKMNRKINVRLDAIASAVIALAILTALVTKASASSPSPESYSNDYLAPRQSGTSAIETAQASQLQNLPPVYVPRSPTQGAPDQTLTLPQAAPQSSQPPPAGLPRSQGQEGTLEVPTEGQPQTIVGRIQVTAKDDTGRWIQDLRKQDLTIYEDGIQRSVLGLQRDTDTPVSIGIVVDTSGSMSWKLAAAEAALQHFVRTLNPSDQVFLTAFSDRSFLLQDFTDNQEALNRAIGILHAGGETALYDAVVQGLQKVEQGRWPKKALLVMTDGMDNKSSNSLNDAIQAARRAGVLIYTVGLGTTGGSAMGTGPMIMFGGGGMRFGGGGFRHHMGGGEDERVDAATLQRLSDETGATTFVMNPRVTDMSALDAHFQSISAELREQYTVRYASAGGGRPHQIRVEGSRPGIEVRAPKWADSAGS
jgi:VWFA-related protein